MAYRVDILAVELRDESLEPGFVSLNADNTKNLLDISSRRGRVAADLEEQVSSDMTHFYVVWM